uniref:Uncharacterized protein n=1 Tax=Arundo donax TaxID=35708 RepID=A0A0A9A7E1_ARUDO
MILPRLPLSCSRVLNDDPEDSEVRLVDLLKLQET